MDTLFFQKVDASGPCWLWTGYTMPSGYGRMTRKQIGYLAHRYAWELLVGPIPNGMELDHLCKVRNCVNPDHPEPVSHAENNRRSGNLAGLRSRQTHCKNGHEFAEENIYRNARGNRVCRACTRKRG